MKNYAAFLRGINVGGNAKVEMVKLKKMFEDMGFEKVVTLLNSGNVVFSSRETDSVKLTEKIKKKLETSFGFSIHIIIRESHEIQNLILSTPFKNIIVTPNTRLYVTFLSGENKSGMKIPYETPEKDFKILQVTDGVVCSALVLSPKRGSVDIMKILEKEFGKQITTRNWNTLLKVGKLLSSSLS